MMIAGAIQETSVKSTARVLDTITSRRSIRHFTAQSIPEGAIDILIEALRWAPSAGNLQSRRFYFVFNENTK